MSKKNTEDLIQIMHTFQTIWLLELKHHRNIRQLQRSTLFMSLQSRVSKCLEPMARFGKSSWQIDPIVSWTLVHNLGQVIAMLASTSRKVHDKNAKILGSDAPQGQWNEFNMSDANKLGWPGLHYIAVKSLGCAQASTLSMLPWAWFFTQRLTYV